MTLPAWPSLLLLALEGGVAWQARALASRRTYHRPFAALVLWLACEDTVRTVVNVAWTRTGHPYHGAALWLWILDRSLWLSWPLALALCSWLVFGPPGQRPWHGLGASLALLAALAYGYPATAAPWVGPAVHAAALAVAGGAVGRWVMGRAGRWPTPSQGMLVAYLSADAALFAGPYWTGRAGWASAAVPLYIALQVSTLAAQSIWGRAIRSSPSPVGRIVA